MFTQENDKDHLIQKAAELHNRKIALGDVWEKVLEEKLKDPGADLPVKSFLSLLGREFILTQLAEQLVTNEIATEAFDYESLDFSVKKIHGGPGSEVRMLLTIKDKNGMAYFFLLEKIAEGSWGQYLSLSDQLEKSPTTTYNRDNNRHRVRLLGRGTEEGWISALEVAVKEGKKLENPQAKAVSPALDVVSPSSEPEAKAPEATTEKQPLKVEEAAKPVEKTPEAEQQELQQPILSAIKEVPVKLVPKAEAPPIQSPPIEPALTEVIPAAPLPVVGEKPKEPNSVEEVFTSLPGESNENPKPDTVTEAPKAEESSQLEQAVEAEVAAVGQLSPAQLELLEAAKLPGFRRPIHEQSEVKEAYEKLRQHNQALLKPLGRLKKGLMEMVFPGWHRAQTIKLSGKWHEAGKKYNAINRKKFEDLVDIEIQIRHMPTLEEHVAQAFSDPVQQEEYRRTLEQRGQIVSGHVSVYGGSEPYQGQEKTGFIYTILRTPKGDFKVRYENREADKYKEFTQITEFVTTISMEYWAKAVAELNTYGRAHKKDKDIRTTLFPEKFAALVNQTPAKVLADPRLAELGTVLNRKEWDKDTDSKRELKIAVADVCLIFQQQLVDWLCQRFARNFALKLNSQTGFYQLSASFSEDYIARQSMIDFIDSKTELVVNDFKSQMENQMERQSNSNLELA